MVRLSPNTATLPEAATYKARRRPHADGSPLRNGLKEYTRERLIQAALTAFSENGFRMTTVERIVQMAGTTGTTFYRHFSSKNDLISALREHLQLQVSKVLLPLNDTAMWTKPRLRTWLDSYAAMWGANHRLCEAFWEATHVDPEYARRAIPDTEALIDLLTNLLDPLPPAERARMRLKLSLLLLLADRAVYFAQMSDPDLRERILDEFALLLLTAGSAS